MQPAVLRRFVNRRRFVGSHISSSIFFFSVLILFSHMSMFARQLQA